MVKNGNGGLFDQVKFALGLGTFIYAVWSIWGGRVGIGKPPWPGEMLGGFGIGPGGDAAEEGGPPAEADAEMAPEETANAMVGWYYGRPIRDHGLGWTLSDFGENDPKNRLTVA